MNNLFNRNVMLNQDIFRNIIFIEKPENLFKDLITSDIKSASQIAMDAQSKVKNNLNIALQDFDYITAISYPFQQMPIEKSRYSNGEYCVWYGSLEHLTTIYETVHHMFRSILAIEGVTNVVRRRRSVYTVNGKAILIDLRGKEEEFPALVANEYEFTQSIGTMIQKEGHPGLLAPSAHAEGSNVVIFNKHVLNNPIFVEYLEYVLDPINLVTTITNASGEILMNIHKNPTHST